MNPDAGCSCGHPCAGRRRTDDHGWTRGCRSCTLTARAPSSRASRLRTRRSRTLRGCGSLSRCVTTAQGFATTASSSICLGLADTDPERSNLDDDQAYESEPLSDVDGASEDIAVLIAPDLEDIGDYHAETRSCPRTRTRPTGSECARERRLGHDRAGQRLTDSR